MKNKNNDVLNTSPASTLKLAAQKPLKTALRDAKADGNRHQNRPKQKQFGNNQQPKKSYTVENHPELSENTAQLAVSKPFGDKKQQHKQHTVKPDATTQAVQQISETKHSQTAKKPKLKVIFLGGVGEIGKNMTAFEIGDEIVVLDAGMTFPTTDMPGVDVVIPDMTYLAENRDKIKAILLTHGHEDHIGAIPFLAQKLGGKLDVFGTSLTLGLVENKLLEHGVVGNVKLHTVQDGKQIKLCNNFSAEFVHVSHSIAGSCAICLRTPVGNVFHSGDFKIDFTPLGSEDMNLARIAQIGNEGILLFMSDSTNVEKVGYTLSERVVVDTINKVFHDAKGRRIIIATFASNIDRLGTILDIAMRYNRKIAISGKSMMRCIETAKRVGYLNVDESMFVDIDKIGSVEDGRLVILSTGSQGEPMSALTRMASGDFNRVQIGSNDTIIISANPIPGNERDVYSVINKLYRLGAEVVYSALQAVHVSGHACQEELKLMYSLIRPKYFIPVHGEYRHLKQHSLLVQQLGHKAQNIIITDIGDVVDVTANSLKLSGKVVSGNIMVDGLGVGDVGNIVLKDRLTLAEGGMLVAVVGMNRRGEIVNGPEIISRGCFFAGDEQADGTVEAVRKLIVSEIEQMQIKNTSNIKTAIQRCVKKYFRTNFKRDPVVLSVVLSM